MHVAAVQVAALEAALRQPFTLIQGPPGTGKTVTSTTLVWLLQQATRGKVLMAAPSNVAVDHLAEKIALTGLKARSAHLSLSPTALPCCARLAHDSLIASPNICGAPAVAVPLPRARLLQRSETEREAAVQVVRLASQRAQVTIAPAVEKLTLRYQVEHLSGAGREALQKLVAHKRDKGELSLDAERKLHALWRKAEAELLAAADVVCVTCIGAGDKRLRRLSFPCVRAAAFA